MPRFRRRPLLRGAAIGGASYLGAKAGTNRAMEQQQAEEARIQAPAAPAAPAGPGPVPQAPPPAGTDDMVAQLGKLASLHDSGALTDDEFAVAKAKLLG